MSAGFSLRRRLLWRLLLPLTALLLLSGFVSYRLALHFADTVYDGWLYDSTESLAQQLHLSPDQTTLDFPTAAEQVFTWDDTDTTYYSIVDSRLGVIAQSRQLPPPPPAARPYRDALHYEAMIGGARLRVSSLDLAVPNSQRKVTVRVAETTRKRDSLARSILLTVLLPQALLLLAAGGLIWRGVGQGLAPLAEVAERIKAQSSENLAPIPDAGAPREVWPLTHALNELLARVEALLSSQRKFIADAAHQLRTPLTALKLNVERAIGDHSAEGRAAALVQLRSGMERATHLAHQLLQLARAEPGGLKATPQQIDLSEFAREIGAEWVPAAVDAGMDLTFDAPADAVTIRGDRTLLREAITNLLDNALRYAGRGAQVTLAVHANPPAVSVSDNGTGMPGELRARAFDRFMRGELGGGGAGLGLSIVREIARSHGGDAFLDEGPSGRGVTVGFRFLDGSTPRRILESFGR